MSAHPQLNSQRPFETKFEGLKSRFAAGVANTAPEERRLGAGLSSSIAQRFGTVGGSQQRLFSGNLAQVGRKARWKIANRGDAAIKNQQLRDRVSIARQALSRRGLSQRAGQSAQRARVGLDASLQASRDTVSSAAFGAAGSIAGGLARGFDSKVDRDFRIDQELENSGIFEDLF